MTTEEPKPPESSRALEQQATQAMGRGEYRLACALLLRASIAHTDPVCAAELIADAAALHGIVQWLERQTAWADSERKAIA